MKYRFNKKELQKEFIGILLVLSLMAIAWGVLILPLSLGMNTEEYTVLDGSLFLAFGIIGMFVSLKLHHILENTKWYESIRRQN